jgi:hypothetical protein
VGRRFNSQDTCTLDGCGRSHYAKGYCNPHWRRWKANGNPGQAEIQSYGRGPCSFQGCGRQASAKKLCGTHYAQYRRGLPLTPIDERVDAIVRDESGNKCCPSCRQWLPVDSFPVETRNADGLATNCAVCKRDKIFRGRYGITAARYDELYAAQGGVCAICKGVNESGRAMAVDHDHSCCAGPTSCGLCVRGLLCSNCNMGIGLLREDVARFEAAIEYLKGAKRGV